MTMALSYITGKYKHTADYMSGFIGELNSLYILFCVRDKTEALLVLSDQKRQELQKRETAR